MAKVVHVHINFVEVTEIKQPECNCEIAAANVVEHSDTTILNHIWTPPCKDRTTNRRSVLIVHIHQKCPEKE